jgi:Ca2+-binding RTX toxin-like protein
VDMGSGDDSIGIYVTNSSGTPAYASLSMVKLDGGSGTDTLSFGNMGTQGSTELTLTGGGATNFENIDGTGGADIIRGNSDNNVLRGSGGADTIYGGAGNDSLSGSSEWSSNNDTDSARRSASSGGTGDDTDDKLYGQAGDDLLIGTLGDNTLDGGTGVDTIYTGSGLDTIVTRSGDGGSSLSNADIIADFTNGSDIIGLSGLNYSDLTVQQGTGSYSSHVVVQEKSSGDFLLIIQNQSIGNIDDNDFSAI